VVHTLLADGARSATKAAVTLGASWPLAIRACRVCDQILTLIMAGHETTAKALSWTLYLLDQHPQELRRVQDEVDQVLCGRPPVTADLPALAACRRAVAEAVRLYPPVWLICRRAVADGTLDRYDV
jgi:cytochrome P450